eukprot:jgi/Astpho2/9125/Aster-02775
MTRVRWFAVPSLIAQTPTDREWSSTSDAILSGMGGLAQLVLAEAGLPPTTALWLRTGYPQGWQRVSSLAKVPPGDLVVKAVVGQSEQHVREASNESGGEAGASRKPRSGRGPTVLPQAEVLQDWKGLSDSQWSNKPKPSWLQGPFHKLTLPQLPADFSHASTASQIQQLVALCVVPVMLAKHQIKGIEDLMRLPSPATTGRQPKLPL